MFNLIAGRARAAFVAAILLAPWSGWAAAPAADAGKRPPAAAPDHYEHDFSDVAKYAKAFEGPKRDAWQKPDDVVSLLQLWPGNVVADVGAGTGYFEPYLAKAVGAAGRVLALDAEPHMVAYLKQRAKKEGHGNVTVQKVSPADPGLPDNSVDRVLIVNTWHHVPQRAQYAAALNRALRPGGFVVVVDFTAESPEGPPAHARLSPGTVIAELQTGGLSARAVAESLPLQYVVIGQKQGTSTGRPAPTPRQRALVDVIKANADQARFTGGVNTHSVEALQKALQPADDPELRALLYHDDPIVVRTAASVFAARGDRGLAILREASAEPSLPQSNRTIVDDVVWLGNARPRSAQQPAHQPAP
jgi:ubiquinone/menaquinone biosynthesis C-methylase UbiE